MSIRSSTDYADYTDSEQAAGAAGRSTNDEVVVPACSCSCLLPLLPGFLVYVICGFLLGGSTASLTDHYYHLHSLREIVAG